MLDITKPVCTRDGRKAEIIGMVPFEIHVERDKRVAAVVHDGYCSAAEIATFTRDGRFHPEAGETCWDLMNVDVASRSEALT